MERDELRKEGAKVKHISNFSYASKDLEIGSTNKLRSALDH